ncbi:MAG TPA: HAD family hydrolase [Pyrinomonadaceae bacterium]|nr:HAD family hydrolase [Pyrinomonadaceae bacterium]
MIKLLALDLDGTTLNSRGAIEDSTRAAIAKAEAARVLVTIATGRRFRDARPLGLELGLNAPLVTHNGALLKFADSGVTTAFSLLSSETARELIKIGQELDAHPMVSTDPTGRGLLLFDRTSLETPALESHIRWSDMLHGKAGREGLRMVDDIVAAASVAEVVHISFSGHCSAMDGMADHVGDILSGRVKVLKTVYPGRDFTLLDILPPDASKGHGVAKLASLNSITAEEVMAIGDNFNDLDMLEYAGTPVLMGNADQSLLERREFYTTLGNDEGGVAAAIERFILDKENV